MSSNKNNSYKLIILALSIFLLIMLFKSYKDNKYSKELQDNLKQESVLTQNQLSEIIEKYDSVTMLYNNYDESFAALNSKINAVKRSKAPINFKNLSLSSSLLKANFSLILISIFLWEKLITK